MGGLDSGPSMFNNSTPSNSASTKDKNTKKKSKAAKSNESNVLTRDDTLNSSLDFQLPPLTDLELQNTVSNTCNFILTV